MVAGPSETGPTCFGSMFTPLSPRNHPALSASSLPILNAICNSLGRPDNIANGDRGNLSLFVGSLCPGNRVGSPGARIMGVEEVGDPDC